MPTCYQCYRVQSGVSPSHRHNLRSPRHHRLAEDMLLRMYEPRPAPHAFERGQRRICASVVFHLSVSEEHHAWQPQLLLVGTHARLPAGLPSHTLDPLAVCVETPSRDILSQYFHLVGLGAVCGAVVAQLPLQNLLARPRQHRRAFDETLHRLIDHLASRLLRRFPIDPECSGRDYEIWRSRILYRLVEQPQCGDILAHVEQAGLPLYEKTHLWATAGKRLECQCGKYDGLCL